MIGPNERAVKSAGRTARRSLGRNEQTLVRLHGPTPAGGSGSRSEEGKQPPKLLVPGRGSCRVDEIAAFVHAAPDDTSDVDGLASTFEAFVDAETARFHGALRLLTRDRAEAEDLMQDAYLKVWER